MRLPQARDYHMHTTEHATYLLDEIVQHNASIPLLLEVVKPMEYSLRHEPTEFQPSALRKNLGLAYAYMVKSSDPIEASEDPFPEVVGHPDIPRTEYVWIIMFDKYSYVHVQVPCSHSNISFDYIQY